MPTPDPILSASVFCDRYLDRVLHCAVGPALEQLRQDDPDAGWRLWWVRYSRNGNHIKVRLHGPAERYETAKRVLGDAVQALFASLPEPDPARERAMRSDIPPIDPEDNATEPYPDRSVVWTRYRRSHVSLGPLFLDDDDYAARMTSCLARAADFVLKATTLDAHGTIPGAVRQRVLLRILINGLAATGWAPSEREVYLAYHRDWLLRFAANDSAHEARVLSDFDGRIRSMGPAVHQLRRAVDAAWSGDEAAVLDAPDEALRRSVKALWDYAAPFRHVPEMIGDPFGKDAFFPILFKALHGAANQVGLNLMSEAFLYHLLLSVVTDRLQIESTNAALV